MGLDWRRLDLAFSRARSLDRAAMGTPAERLAPGARLLALKRTRRTAVAL